MTTDRSGNVTGTNLLSPYGETISSNTGDSYSYAGLAQDTEYGGDAATFRNYSTEQLRWTRPDSYNGSYDLSNPQSMNRYVYAMNNPLAFTDPSGLDDEDGNEDVIFTTIGQASDGTYILAPEGSPIDSFMWGNDISTTPIAWNNGQLTEVTDASLGYIQLNNPGEVFLLGELGYLPNGDRPVGMDIWHCPGCPATWRNADVTVHGLAIATAAVAAAPFAVSAAPRVAHSSLLLA